MNQVLNRIIALTMQQVIVFGIILAGAYGFMYTYDTYNVLTAKNDAIEKEITKELEIQKDTDSTLKKELEVKDSVAALSLQFDKLSKILPPGITQSDIMAYIDEFSKKSSVKVTAKVPQSSSSMEVVELLPVTVTLKGSYFEIGRFIQLVSVNQPITRVSDYKISRDGSNTGTYVFDGRIIGYRSVEQKPDKAEGVKK